MGWEVKKIKLILFCVLAFNINVQADDSLTLESRTKLTSGIFSDNYNPQGFWGFIGLNLGVIDSETSVSGENDAAGSQFDLRALGSLYVPNTDWLIDLGLGLQNSHIGKGQLDKDVSAMYLELSPRIKLSQKWQAGPVAKVLVLGDHKFFDDSEAPVGFVGLALDYEVPWLQDNLVRFGGRIMSDMNVDSRRVTMAMIDLQIGMPFTNKPQVRTVERNVKVAPAVKVEEEKQVETEIITEELVALKNVELDGKNISFQLGKVLPTKKSQEFLSRLGKLLSENENVLEGINISGHTDDTGKDITNKILSHSRAQLAARALAAAGLSSEKLEVKSFSDSQPIAFETNTKFKNRRIEIIFKGVKDEKKLKEIIKQAL